ncbi:MAG: crossover junction endodeoxyribonuclease RuvC [Oligoflexales bacterium]|nr:crossover junction endodeoxyribonuclease RuvC [Oligoflexales bacterium]
MGSKVGQLRILGIDPGSRIVGFAVIDTNAQMRISTSTCKIVDVGVIKTDVSMPYSERISLIHEAVYEIICCHSPHICIIEKAFVGINSLSALKLGEARGALLCAIHRAGVKAREVAPTEVKKLVTGDGRASKEQVNMALATLLNFKRGTLPYDASDALAIALYYGMVHPLESLKAYPGRAEPVQEKRL